VVDTTVSIMMDRYGESVSIDDAAKIVDSHPDTVRKLQREGRFPAYTVRGRIKCFVPDLVQWMRDGGEAQYEPLLPSPIASSSVRTLRPRRRSDTPSWMGAAMAGGKS
jgi:hypothetical protein